MSTSSTAPGSAPVRRTISAITNAPRSSGRTSASAPRYRPTGVRTASTTKTSRGDGGISPLSLLKAAHGRERRDHGTICAAKGREGRHGHRRWRWLLRRDVVVESACEEDAAHRAEPGAPQCRPGRNRTRFGCRLRCGKTPVDVENAPEHAPCHGAGPRGQVYEQHALPARSVSRLIWKVSAQQPRREADIETDQDPGRQIESAVPIRERARLRGVAHVWPGGRVQTSLINWGTPGCRRLDVEEPVSRVGIGARLSNGVVPRGGAIRMPLQGDLSQGTRQSTAERGALDQRDPTVGRRTFGEQRPGGQAERQAGEAPREPDPQVVAHGPTARRLAGRRIGLLVGGDLPSDDAHPEAFGGADPHAPDDEKRAIV